MCYFVGIGVLKGSQMTVRGMCCIDLNNYTLKILGTHFSYNEKLKKEKKYETVAAIQRVLKMWRMRNLTLEGKTIAISKIVLQSFTATVPKHTINKIARIQKAFLWKNASPKIRHETLCNDYKAVELKILIFQTKL